MINYKAIITILISCLLFFTVGIFIGKYKFSTQEIKIVEKKVYETKWKTKIEYVKNPDTGKNQPIFDQNNFNRLLNCYDSPLNFKDRTEKNYLFVTAFDDCKEATARYKISQKGNWKIYFTFAGIGVVAGGVAVYYLRK